MISANELKSEEQEGYKRKCEYKEKSELYMEYRPTRILIAAIFSIPSLVVTVF